VHLIKRPVTDISIYIDPLSIAGVRETDHGILGKIVLFLWAKHSYMTVAWHWLCHLTAAVHSVRELT